MALPIRPTDIVIGLQAKEYLEKMENGSDAEHKETLSVEPSPELLKLLQKD